MTVRDMTPMTHTTLKFLFITVGVVWVASKLLGAIEQYNQVKDAACPVTLRACQEEASKRTASRDELETELKDACDKKLYQTTALCDSKCDVEKASLKDKLKNFEEDRDQKIEALEEKYKNDLRSLGDTHQLINQCVISATRVASTCQQYEKALEKAPATQPPEAIRVPSVDVLTPSAPQ